MVLIKRILKFEEYWNKIQEIGTDIYTRGTVTKEFKEIVYSKRDLSLITAMINYFLECEYITLKSTKIETDLIRKYITEFLARNKHTELNLQCKHFY